MQTGFEPVRALRRTAVGEGFRRDIATRLLLQAIVSDRTGRGEPFFDITLVQQLAAAVGMMAPDTGKSVGLEFLFAG